MQLELITVQRSGFPDECPTGYANEVTFGNCLNCPSRFRTEYGTWQCNHASYQFEQGFHFCIECGTELGPWAEANGWALCGGPSGKCLRHATLSSNSPKGT